MTQKRSDDVSIVAQTIFDKKGCNIVTLDVRGVSTMTDFFIIAEGTVNRHVKALARAVVDKFDELGESPLHIEGDKTGDWLVLDFGDVVVHIFTPGLREKYAIERLWHEGRIVDVEFDMNE